VITKIAIAGRTATHRWRIGGDRIHQPAGSGPDKKGADEPRHRSRQEWWLCPLFQSLFGPGALPWMAATALWAGRRRDRHQECGKEVLRLWTVTIQNNTARRGHRQFFATRARPEAPRSHLILVVIPDRSNAKPGSAGTPRAIVLHTKPRAAARSFLLFGNRQLYSRANRLWSGNFANRDRRRWISRVLDQIEKT